MRMRTTTLVTVNAAFLREIKEVHHELWEGLNALQLMCDNPISLKGQSFEFVGRLSDLRDQLALYFALEEAYGYFDDPEVVMAPISAKAHELREQHRELYKELDRIVELAESLLYERRLGLLTTMVPVAFEKFSERLDAHEHEENALLQEVLLTDLGVGD